MRAFFVHLLVLCAFQAKCYDYFYWKELCSSIKPIFPSDALAVGTDVYIGQAFLSINEICVGTHRKEDGDLDVACNGYKRNWCYYVKLLCTDRPQDFAWLRTTSRTFSNDTEGKTLVQGGFVYDPYYGPLSIGRTMVDGHFVVGNICPVYDSEPLGDRTLAYAYNGTDHYVDSFEVLIYMG